MSQSHLPGLFSKAVAALIPAIVALGPAARKAEAQATDTVTWTAPVTGNPCNYYIEVAPQPGPFGTPASQTFIVSGTATSASIPQQIGSAPGIAVQVFAAGIAANGCSGTQLISPPSNAAVGDPVIRAFCALDPTDANQNGFCRLQELYVFGTSDTAASGSVGGYCNTADKVARLARIWPQTALALPSGYPVSTYPFSLEITPISGRTVVNSGNVDVDVRNPDCRTDGGANDYLWFDPAR